MDLLGAIIICGGLIAFGLVSRKLEGTIVTAPLVFILFGFAIGHGGFGIAPIEPEHGIIHLVAELTLVLVLFSDAARIDLKMLRRDHNLPERMLVIGLPLIILAGTGAAMLLFPAFSLWEAALLAAILAPTDAAAGPGRSFCQGGAGAHPPGPERRKRAERRHRPAGGAALRGPGQRLGRRGGGRP